MTAHQKRLAELAERDRQYAAMFGRTSKYSTVMTEGHDSGNMGGEGTATYGPKSAFAQITSVTGIAVDDVIR